jgi:hypothetical protein
MHHMTRAIAVVAIAGISACTAGQAPVTRRTAVASWCDPGRIAVSIPAAVPDHVPLAGGIFTDDVEVRLRGDRPCRVAGTPAITLFLGGHQLRTRDSRPHRNYSLMQGYVRPRPILLWHGRRTAVAEVDWHDQRRSGGVCSAGRMQPDHALIRFPHVSAAFRVRVPPGDLHFCGDQLTVFPLTTPYAA